MTYTSQQIEKLFKDAYPINEDDAGSERQYYAEYDLWTALDEIDPDTFSETSDFSCWALKATTEEMLNEAYRLWKTRKQQA